MALLRRASSPSEVLGLARAGRDRYSAIESRVAEIIRDVMERGDEALLDYLRRFHGVEGLPVRLGEDEVERLASSVEPEVARALEVEAERVEAVAKSMVPGEVSVETVEGVRVTVAYKPVERLGVYVPRGKASYPSTAVMIVATARAAGVKGVAVASPPDERGALDPAIVYAAYMLGVREFYRLGGAYAAAALALGTASVRRVDMLAGPGGAWFTAAKKLLYGTVGIDMLAGPTELLVVADGTVDPRIVAWDMAAQAEHSADTLVGLIALSDGYIERVEMELADIIDGLETGDTVKASLERSGFAYVAGSLEEALRLADEVAPEHLYVASSEVDGRTVKSMVSNVGSVSVGPWSAPALSDYTAGSNHVLPTDGWARFRGGLSVLDFLKPVYIVEADARGFKASCGDAVKLAVREGLPGHAGSLMARGCP